MVTTGVSLIASWVLSIPWDHVSNISKKMGLDPRLVGAIVSVESGGNWCAVRYESHYKWLKEPEKYAKLHGITVETETMMQKSSFGLMQIMLATARDLGFDLPAVMLCDPLTGLEYGAKYLKQLMHKYAGNMQDAIAAYNSGQPIKDAAGVYKNQVYVDKVMERYNYLKNEA